MVTKIAINGFGRIGRLAFRTAIQKKEVDVIAVNDIADPKTLAHLLKYDSIFGRFPAKVELEEESILVDGREVKALSVRDPAELPWNELEVDVVIESTGIFRIYDQASKHLKAGAKKVLISAPMKNPDITLMLAINTDLYDPERHHVISMASCTTNAVVPPLKVLNDEFNIVKGEFTTVHAYTNDQKLLDMVHRDLRRARAAALNIIPTTTGAAKAVSLLLPELRGKLEALAIRIPVAVVSIVDITVEVGGKVSVREVNDSFKKASRGPLRGMLGFVEEPLVSQDFKGDPTPSIVDGLLTTVVGENLVKTIVWYDNEWGYSTKLIDMIVEVLGPSI